MNKAKIIERAKALAVKKYEKGYDTFAECYGEKEWEKLVDDLSWPEVKKLMADIASVWADRRADAEHYRE